MQSYVAEDPQCVPAPEAPERLSGREDWPSGRECGGSAQAYRHGYPGLCEADVHHQKPHGLLLRDGGCATVGRAVLRGQRLQTAAEGERGGYGPDVLRSDAAAVRGGCCDKVRAGANASALFSICFT